LYCVILAYILAVRRDVLYVMVTSNDAFHDVTNELFLRSVFELSGTRLETDCVTPHLE
jgi:hypothetical protein